jgi:hypothetical protein
MNIVGMTSLRGAHSGGPCLEIASGMGKTGAAAGFELFSLHARVFEQPSHLCFVLYVFVVMSP